MVRRFLSAVCSVASAHDGGLRTADDRVARLACNFDFQFCFILLSKKQSDSGCVSRVMS